MSKEIYNSCRESLELFDTEIPEEDIFGELEIQHHFENEDFPSINFGIDKESEDEHSFVYDNEFKSEIPLNQINSLRMELALMSHRKNNVMKMFPEFIQSRLVSIYS